MVTIIDQHRTEWNIEEIICVSVVGVMFVTLVALFILGKLQQFKFRRLPVVPVPEPKEYTFHDLSYQVGKKKILHHLEGCFPPSTLNAIMGPSGAGKSSMLDILAHKPKKGKVHTHFSLDGSPLRYPSSKFQHIIGFVDQEDVLLPWLTVDETLWFVANSRLPESMTYKEKKIIIENVLTDLNIMNIRNSRVGGDGTFRGISGGERRRLSVAMELITSPCILFLDEPTSGLDSYHALKLMQTLAQLAQIQKKTIICTIHQPRQDVYALFDRVVLMSQGHIIYQGPASESQNYFSQRGLGCPIDQHIADHMIEIAMRSDVFDLVHVQPHLMPLTLVPAPPVITEMSPTVTPQMHNNYSINVNTGDAFNNFSKRIYQVSFLTQFYCLINRNLKCSIRNYRLFLGHNIMAIVWGLFLGATYYQTPLNTAGLQNRLGLFIFIQLLIAFTSLSALSSVACDRLLFMRERGNTYYRPSAYFVSKVTMDILPLRILPTLLTGTIAYFLTGLQITFLHFAKYISVLLLFNIGTCAFCMFAGVFFVDVGLGNFLASMIMLISMLFNGLQLSLDLLPKSISWIQYFSFFRWASEALNVNELIGLTFSIELNGTPLDNATGQALLVENFKMNINSYTLNLCILAIMDMAFLALVGMFVVFKLREIR
ncbi:hypothetical protein HMI54_009322 [Coelomomyces lativittatus]|nr:hypothetical protein HMI54_009322 [Coelomomyces lativittatus]